MDKHTVKTAACVQQRSCVSGTLCWTSPAQRALFCVVPPTCSPGKGKAVASPTRWTGVWANSGSWWWTGRPGVLRFMGSQRVGHDWATELNWKGQNTDERLPGIGTFDYEGTQRIVQANRPSNFDSGGSYKAKFVSKRMKITQENVYK